AAAADDAQRRPTNQPRTIEIRSWICSALAWATAGPPLRDRSVLCTEPCGVPDFFAQADTSVESSLRRSISCRWSTTPGVDGEPAFPLFCRLACCWACCCWSTVRI